MQSDGLNFVEYDKSFLEKSWYWLHDLEIKALTNTPDFTKAQQEIFFNSLPREDYKIWGVKFKDVAIGVVGIKNIDGEEAEYFGYIGDKNYWGKGLFTGIIEFVQLEAIKINLKLLHLKVGRNNHRAFRAYEREGFKTFSINDDFYFMKKEIKNYVY